MFDDAISVAPENAGKRREEFESIPSRRQAEPTADYISVERNFTEVCVFARPLAELPAPPTMRHHAETSATMIADLMLADLRLSHHTLLQQFDRVFVEIWYYRFMDAMSVINVTIYDLLLNCYLTVTTAIGSSAGGPADRYRPQIISGYFGARGRLINNLSLHCHDPNVSVSDKWP